MDFGPVERIRAVGPVSVARSSAGVSPPFAVDQTDRLGLDSYIASSREQERGLEEQDQDESGKDEEAQDAEEPTATINLFA